MQPPEHRMAWLDALRGIAALLVIHEHTLILLFPGAWSIQYRWFACGYAGVCLFFLISGYIIPASLERGGDLRRFWVSRAFRLYPLFLFVLVLLGLLHVLGLRSLEPYAVRHPVASAAAQATMMPRLLGVPETLGVTWTLAFEMAFYLVVAGLFALGWQRAGTPIAWLLAGVALVVGGATPVALLTDSALHPRLLIFGGIVLLAAAVAGMVSGRRPAVVAGAVLGGSFAALLVLVNQNPVHRWDGLLLPALMFTGTALYRAERGQLKRRWAALTATVVAVAWVVQEWRMLAEAGPEFSALIRQRIVITLGVVGLLFAVGWALRHRRIPRPLAWLGLISYSVYLLHLVVLETVLPHLGRLGIDPPAAPLPVQAALYLGLVALMLWCSTVTYRFVEAPAQRLGRRLTRKPPATPPHDATRPAELARHGPG